MGRTPRWGREGLRSGGDIWPRRSAVALLPDSWKKKQFWCHIIYPLSKKWAPVSCHSREHLSFGVFFVFLARIYFGGFFHNCYIMMFDASLLQSYKKTDRKYLCGLLFISASRQSLQSFQLQLSHVTDCFCPLTVAIPHNKCTDEVCALLHFIILSALLVASHLCDQCSSFKIKSAKKEYWFIPYRVKY